MADNFFTDTIALMRSSADGQRAMQCAREAIATDRWNSFDKFHQTTRTLARRFRQAGAKTEIYTIPTGGPIGSGRWIIHQAADIRSATCDVISPINRRLIDYKQCPWHVVQWSAATPRSGLTGQVIVLDTDEAINRARPADVRGKVVLTSLYSWPVMPKLAALGAIAVISDDPSSLPPIRSSETPNTASHAHGSNRTTEKTADHPTAHRSAHAHAGKYARRNRRPNSRHQAQRLGALLGRR